MVFTRIHLLHHKPNFTHLAQCNFTRYQFMHRHYSQIPSPTHLDSPTQEPTKEKLHSMTFLKLVTYLFPSSKSFNKLAFIETIVWIYLASTVVSYFLLKKEKNDYEKMSAARIRSLEFKISQVGVEQCSKEKEDILIVF